MKKYRTTAHSKYDLKVHVIFLPKYRGSVLKGYIAISVRDMIRQICTEEDVEILSGKVASDHVHLFVSYPPHLSISDLLQKIKGKSSYKLMHMYPAIRKIAWARHFWARGYMAVSSGNITHEVIQKYIEEQDGEDVHHAELEVF